MIYLCCLLLLFIIEFSYYKLAQKAGITAPMRERTPDSVHRPTTGGIIIPIAAIMFACLHFNALSVEWITMLCGALTLAIISFIDDLHPLPAKPRLLAQSIIIALILQPYLRSELTGWYIFTVFCGVGCVNSFNFIDGINGILGKLSAVVIVSIIAAYILIKPANAEIFIEFGYIMLLGVAVFMCFNMHDRLFSGDVGSITIGLFIVWMLFYLIHSTFDLSLMVLTSVCLTDTALTMLQRLLNGENILKPHRKHIYQVLTAQWGLTHTFVASAYATVQLIINAIYLSLPNELHHIYAATVCIVLTIAYIYVRKSAKSGVFSDEKRANSCKCD